MLRKGDRVTIFQSRPKEGVEGEATLVYWQHDRAGVCDGRLLQRWLVKFTGDARQYSRAILSDVPYDWVAKADCCAHCGAILDYNWPCGWCREILCSQCMKNRLTFGRPCPWD